MEVMVIYVWQCMVVLLYDCICARWLWSIMNEHATATINTKGCTLMIVVEEHEQKWNIYIYTTQCKLQCVPIRLCAHW